MGYVEKKVLQNGENIVKKVDLNAIDLIFAWIWGVLGCWLLFIPTIKAIKETIYFCTTELVVTNKSVIEKYGWFNTHCDQMPLGKIENVTINQGFFGKIFNYGNVCIQGANKNNVNFRGVKNPEEVRRIINNSISENQQ